MPLRSLSAPVAFFCLEKGEPVVGSLTDSFASALGLEVTTDQFDEPVHRLSVASLFGEAAVVPFRECLEASIAGQLVSRRIPIVHAGKSSSRIFMFHPGESEHAGGSFLVALERRSRSTLPVMPDENSAEHLAALNGHMFFTHNLETTSSHYLNPVMSTVLGLPETGLDARRLMRHLHSGDIPAFRTCIDALPNLVQGQVLTLTIRLRAPYLSASAWLRGTTRES
jgi:hypothetical protein